MYLYDKIFLLQQRFTYILILFYNTELSAGYVFCTVLRDSRVQLSYDNHTYTIHTLPTYILAYI